MPHTHSCFPVRDIYQASQADEEKIAKVEVKDFAAHFRVSKLTTAQINTQERGRCHRCFALPQRDSSQYTSRYAAAGKGGHWSPTLPILLHTFRQHRVVRERNTEPSLWTNTGALVATLTWRSAEKVFCPAHGDSPCKERITITIM